MKTQQGTPRSCHAAIHSIRHAFPAGRLTNERLCADFPDWSPGKIQEKTGIVSRHITAPNESASDLGYQAAINLIDTLSFSRSTIDFLIFCSQNPDAPLPATACPLQERLQLSCSCGAIDLPIGCSGFVYSLGIAKGLIETGQARNVLLINAETYSKYIDPSDRNVRTLFGDAGTATLITGVSTNTAEDQIGPLIYGTDGRGAANLCMQEKERHTPQGGEPHAPPFNESTKTTQALYMNGPEIFTFTLATIPNAVEALLDKAKLTKDEIDLFVFHQANAFMLNHLRERLEISPEKFLIHLADCGNTVSCSIPLALEHAARTNRLKPGHRVMLVGFGVGYSWSATVIRWQGWDDAADGVSQRGKTSR